MSILVAATSESAVIATGRLIMRRHRLDDFSASAAMWADPGVTRHIGGRPFSQEESWARLLRYAGHWTLLGLGYWAVEEKASGRFIGEVGFADFKRDIDPPIRDIPEIGWAFATEAHGKGYATEAVHAAIAWGDRHFACTRTVCVINPDNLPSIRVAEKCGYREYKRTLYKGQAAIMFAREKPTVQPESD